MKSNSFKTKVLLLTATVFLLSIALIITYNALSRLNAETKNAEQQAALMTEDLSKDLKIKIDYAFDVLRAESQNFAVIKSKLDRNTANEMLTNSLKNNPDFLPGTHFGNQMRLMVKISNL